MLHSLARSMREISNGNGINIRQSKLTLSGNRSAVNTVAEYCMFATANCPMYERGVGSVRNQFVINHHKHLTYTTTHLFQCTSLLLLLLLVVNRYPKLDKMGKEMKKKKRNERNEMKWRYSNVQHSQTLTPSHLVIKFILFICEIYILANARTVCTHNSYNSILHNLISTKERRISRNEFHRYSYSRMASTRDFRFFISDSYCGFQFHFFEYE